MIAPTDFGQAQIDCPEYAPAVVYSVEFTGNVAWATVAAGDGTELQVYVRNGASWERIPYSSEPDPYWEYVFELENEAMGGGLQPTNVRLSTGEVSRFRR